MARDDRRYGAVILAAGFSSRMNAFKPLMPLGDSNVIRTVAAAAIAAGLSDIVVVTGHMHEKIAADLAAFPLLQQTPRSEQKAGTEAELKSEQKAGLEAELKSESEPGSQHEPGPESETGSETELESESKTEPACRVRMVLNEHFAEGMFTSIVTGLSALQPGNAGCFLMPVDCPLVSGAVIRRMIEVIENGTAGKAENGPNSCPAADAGNCTDFDVENSPAGSGSAEFAVPTFRGKKGHPLFIPACRFEEIIAYRGSGGLKGVTDRYFDRMLRIPVDDEGSVLDMDNEEGYAEVRNYLACGSGPSLQELAAGRRIILIRHGQIEQHREKIFLGQTDVPLSKKGRQQAAAAGRELSELAPAAGSIYCSSLQRARVTAEIIAEAGSGQRMLTVEPVPGLEEMSLGAWDGRYISEIKERYPEQYRMRGSDIFTFKTGNGSENFFDMQYRAVKALKKILAADQNKDVIIVSHRGVLRALENNLRGGDVSDEWEDIKNCQIRILYAE